jgi:hypothetical protein
MTGRCRFNIYLLLLCAALAGSGCASTDPQKIQKKKDKDKLKLSATLSIHLEVPVETMSFSKRITVFRDKPVTLNVDSSSILTEANITEAKVLDTAAGFALQIQFDRQGTWLLENYSTTNPGKRYAIMCEFGDKTKESRWLAAPVIPRRISNGVLTFTPDASREEADLIVLGLNNVARKIQDDLKF